jgi:diaminohydroxyphosphoribosylaminopyrimidine deaminase/5-amino-6-(5-phosphoribosylamino)uracil reductase
VKEDIQHETYINRCLDLARLASGETAPNPLVGSVIVHAGRIIGEGLHCKFGRPHAEVNAINSVRDQSLLNDSTLYVNLEPCSHTGKTPPCSDLIIQNGIPRVVVGTVDPNPVVSGKGIRTLKKAGIKVICNILPEKCRELNKRFFTYHLQKRPYIILKWAKTTDGFIDLVRQNPELPQHNWISNNISRMIVHQWRAEEQAILIGTNTALFDNPRLNVREWPGNSPLRLVIDRNLRLPDNLNLFDQTLSTLVFNAVKDCQQGKIRYVKLDFKESILHQLLNYLYNIEIQSVFVEGGKRLIESFLNEDLWDEARVFTGKKQFGLGVSSPVIPAVEPDEYLIREDLLQVYRHHTDL